MHRINQDLNIIVLLKINHQINSNGKDKMYHLRNGEPCEL